MCQPQTEVQTRRRLTTLLVSLTNRVVFFCRCLRGKELLPVYFLLSPDSIRPRRLHLGRARPAPLPGDGGSLGNVVLSPCDTESISFERNGVWAEKEKMDLSLSGDVSFVTVWKNLNQVCQLCCGPRVYFQDTEGYLDVFLELLKLEGHAVMLQGWHRRLKWDTGISLHSVSVCLVWTSSDHL